MSLAVNNQPSVKAKTPLVSEEKVKKIVKEYKANHSFRRALEDINKGKTHRMLVLARQNNIKIPEGDDILKNHCIKIGKAMGANGDLVTKLVGSVQEAKKQIALATEIYQTEMKLLKLQKEKNVNEINATKIKLQELKSEQRKYFEEARKLKNKENMDILKKYIKTVVSKLAKFTEKFVK